MRPSEQRGAKASTAFRLPRRLVCFSVLFAGITAGSFFLFSTEAPVAPRIDPASLQGGEIWVTDEFKWELPITNPSDRHMRIDGFISSCGCAAIKPEKLILKPRERMVLTGIFNFTKRRTQAHIQPFEVKIIPVVDGLPSHAPWVLHGTLLNPIDVSQTRILFDDITARHSAQFEIDVGAHAPLSKLTATLDQPKIGATIITPRQFDEEGFAAKFRVRISTTPSLPVGRFATKLRISVETASGDVLSNVVVLPVSGNVVPRIVAFPQHIFAGTLTPMDNFVQVLLINCPDDDMALAQVAAKDPAILVQRAAVHDSGSWIAYEVSISSIELGRQQNAILISAVDGHGERESLRVPITYFGEGPFD